MPGDNITMEVELQAPIAMEEKLRFRRPRRRQDRRFGRRDQDPRLSEEVASCELGVASERLR